MSTLKQLYESHDGKVSDRWSLYLETYDRLLASWRERALRMLEIGVQNGGSLEIWSKYFPRATKLVGCDINPDCGLLHYDDPRIEVIVGDASDAATHARIAQSLPVLDLVIDDGSHHSRDIVVSFAKYFPMIEDGGIFIAEDLHCSYWLDYEGGLFNPTSSIAFFKALADVVNHEHWGREYARTELFDAFQRRWGIELEEDQLARVHSVEFINSICVVRKADPQRNAVGPRVVTRGVEAVACGHHALAGYTIERFDQHLNASAQLDAEPVRRIARMEEDLRSMARLEEDLRYMKAQLTEALSVVEAMRASRSWRYTSWLRRFRQVFVNQNG